MPKPITREATRYAAQTAKKAITGFITRIGTSTTTRPPSGGFFVSGAT